MVRHRQVVTAGESLSRRP